MYNYRAFTSIMKYNTVKYNNERLNRKVHDIESYIASSMHYDRDMMPHSGKYYNRKKWLNKLGLWKYG